MATQARIPVVVRKRDGVVWQGEATSLSGKNGTGKFDVLPFHANFISTLVEEVIIRSEKGDETIAGEGALLRVRDNRVEVLLGVKSVEAGREANEGGS